MLYNLTSIISHLFCQLSPSSDIFLFFSYICFILLNCLIKGFQIIIYNTFHHSCFYKCIFSARNKLKHLIVSISFTELQSYFIMLTAPWCACCLCLSLSLLGHTGIVRSSRTLSVTYFRVFTVPSNVYFRLWAQACVVAVNSLNRRWQKRPWQ